MTEKHSVPVPSDRRNKSWADDAKYTIAVDFDGVIHSYTSGWEAPDVIPDPPVPGAIGWLNQMVKKFKVVIFTTRGQTRAGQEAVASYLSHHGFVGSFKVTAEKPAALIYLGRWMVRFDGDFSKLMPLAQSDKALALKAKREGEIPDFSEADWGYVGALIDGEGSFLSRKNGDGRPYVALDITNQHIEVLEWLQAQVGGSINKQDVEGKFPVYHWNLPGARMTPLLRGLLERRLIRMKWHQAIWSLEYLSLCRYDGQPAREIDKVRKEQLQKAIGQMNRHGTATFDPVVLDDRAVRFDGTNFPTADQIHRELIPWNKRPMGYKK